MKTFTAVPIDPYAAETSSFKPIISRHTPDLVSAMQLFSSIQRLWRVSNTLVYENEGPIVGEETTQTPDMSPTRSYYLFVYMLYLPRSPNEDRLPYSSDTYKNHNAEGFLFGTRATPVRPRPLSFLRTKSDAFQPQELSLGRESCITMKLG
jgi:hypothetical protein